MNRPNPLRALALWLLLMPAVGASEPPTLVMAEMMEAGDPRLPPLAAVRLDTSGMVPVDGRWPERVVVHILNMPDSHYYWTAFDRDKAVYELSAETLTPVEDAPPFYGLPPGATVFFILATEVYPGSVGIGVMFDFGILITRIEAP